MPEKGESMTKAMGISPKRVEELHKRLRISMALHDTLSESIGEFKLAVERGEMTIDEALFLAFQVGVSVRTQEFMARILGEGMK